MVTEQFAKNAWESTEKALRDWVVENGHLPWGYTTEFVFDEEIQSYKWVTRILSHEEVFRKE